MSANFIPSTVEMLRFAPEIILALAGILIMLLEAITGDRDKTSLGYLSIIGLIAAMVAACVANGEPGYAFQRMLVVDGFATFFRIVVIGVGILTILLSTNYLSEAKLNIGDYYALVLFSVPG